MHDQDGRTLDSSVFATMLFTLFQYFDEITSTGHAAGWSKITLRCALAAITAYLLAVLFGGKVIAWLKSRFREPNNNRSPILHDLHRHKTHTPTMGGLFLVGALLVAALLFCDWSNRYVPIVLANMLGLATIGAIDDLLKLAGRGPGLRPKTKFRAQVIVAALSSLALFAALRSAGVALNLQIPLVGFSIPLGPGFIPLATLVIVSTSNAVNLTDGLDGLAGGCLFSATAAMSVLVYIAGHAELADYVGVPHVRGAGETVVIAGAMLGALLGFLWFNCQPAQVFMGDTGSLALGGTLGLLAVVARQEILLGVIGAVFVAEAASVMLQVMWHRRTGRRIFRCAPLHHHFQFLGWAESKIVARFWIVSTLCALIGLGALKLNRSDESLGSESANLAQASSVVTQR